MRIILALALLLLIGPVQAACSGSGLAFSCPSGATPSDVNTAIGSASDGAVLTFANGSYSWGGTRITPSASKEVTLICDSGATCSVGYSSVVFGFPTSSSSKLFRISGFAFTDSGGGFLLWTCPGGGCTNTWSQFRFDHNSVNLQTGGVAIFIGENTAQQFVYGVVDHNTFTSAGSSYVVEWINDTNNSSDPAAEPDTLGTINNLFFEDNSIDFDAITNLGTGCSDHWGQSAIVWRYNTSNNCRVISHGVTHGWGPSNFEVYNNTITEDDSAGLGCYRCIHHQGSDTYMVFNNTLTTVGTKEVSSVIVFLHYRDVSGSVDGGLPYCDGTVSYDGNRSPIGTNRGYPCFRQPGRTPTGAYSPMYAWNNKWSDTLARIPLNFDSVGGYAAEHIQNDREYYNAVSANAQSSASSPFDGTTGMGFGTLARRPTTCTTSSETGLGAGDAGVGYFATDQGTQGTLYTCSATDTWTVYYTPYTYPHPLVGGGDDSSGDLVIILAQWAAMLVGIAIYGALYGKATISRSCAAASALRYRICSRADPALSGRPQD